MVCSMDVPLHLSTNTLAKNHAMGTPCLVGVQDPVTGQIHYIYIRFDGGYRDGVGEILMDCYATYEDARALVDGGKLLAGLSGTLRKTRATNYRFAKEEEGPNVVDTVAEYCAAIKRETGKGYLFTPANQWAMRKNTRWFTEARDL
jgi:hypothetical protein